VHTSDEITYAVSVLALLHSLHSTGCQRGSGDERPRAAAEPAPPSSLGVGREMFEHSIVLRLRLPRESRLGSTVPLQLEVENTSKDSVTLSLPGRGSVCRFEVRASDGRLMWPLPRPPQLVELPLELRTLGPNSGFVCEDVWPAADQSRAGIKPGVYSVVGVLRGGPTDMISPPAKLLLRE
jgi:hypothetical protein